MWFHSDGKAFSFAGPDRASSDVVLVTETLLTKSTEAIHKV